MASIQNDRDKLLQAAPVRFVPPPLPPEMVDAINATKGLSIRSTGTQFHRTTTGDVSPLSVTLTIDFRLITGTVTWTVVSGSATLSGTGNTRTLSSANMLSERVTIRASLTVDSVTYTDEIDITRVSDGMQGPSGMQGTDGDSVDIVFRRNPTQPATPSPSSGTPSNWYSAVDQVPPINAPMWSSVGFRAGGTGLYIWETPIRVEGVDGIDGLSVVELTIYRRATSTPATPTGGSFNFTNQTLTPPSGWSVSVPTGSDPVYMSKAIASIQGVSGSSPVSGWTSPVIALQNGANGATGATGAPGVRGTVHVTVARAAASWDDASANSAITSFTGSSLRVKGDQVTQYRTASGWAQTRYWTGTAWQFLEQVIDGNLIVTGTISANDITSGTFTGPTFRTKASGRRIEIAGNSSEIVFYNHPSDNNIRTVMRAQNLSGVNPVGLEIGSAGSTVGVQIVHNLGSGPALRVHNSASSASHPALQFSTTTRGVPIELGNSNLVPTQKPIGGICFAGGWLMFCNGTNWIRSDGTVAG